MDTSLLKEELTSIPIWVKLHDVPLQVFEEDGISLIDTLIGKPVMLDSYKSSMCNESWGRSSFARCLIEVNSEVDLVDVVTIGIPSLTGDGFTKKPSVSMSRFENGFKIDFKIKRKVNMRKVKVIEDIREKGGLA
ncbi:zinc knuckle CX2CX4HX4C containing protein [Tanacetum coccineum]